MEVDAEILNTSKINNLSHPKNQAETFPLTVPFSIAESTTERKNGKNSNQLIFKVKAIVHLLCISGRSTETETKKRRKLGKKGVFGGCSVNGRKWLRAGSAWL